MIGREREIAVVSAFLDSIAHGSQALLLQGEAGIGKSTVCFEAVRLAPQERALAATLLRVATDEPADPRTTATALLGMLGELVGLERRVPPSSVRCLNLLFRDRDDLVATAGGRATVTAGTLALNTGRGSLAGHVLRASFSGTGPLGGGYTLTYQGTYR